MKTQNIKREIDHFRKTDWYRSDSSEELDPSSVQKYVDDLILKTSIASHTKVLEVASGGGHFGTALVEKTGASYVGIDLMPELVKDATRRGKDQGLDITFVQGDAHKLPFGDSSFDVVFITYSLHHFPSESLKQVIGEIWRVLKKDGYFYGLEPNGFNPLVFAWWLKNSPERILPLGKKWRETKALSVNETIIYPWQVYTPTKKIFHKTSVYSLGFIPKGLKFFDSNPLFWNNVGSTLEKIPLINLLGGSFVVLGRK